MNSKRIIVILSVLLVLATGAAVYFGVTGAKAKREITYVKMPDVTSLEASDAEKLITNVGLKVGTVTTEHSADVPDDHVISSDPKAEKRVEEGTEVSLVVSSGPEAPAMVSVPDLTGLSQDDAEAELSAAKLVAVPADPEYTDASPAGVVFKQSIAAGSQVEEGTQVTFTVALGQLTVSVPNVVGKSSADAKAALSQASLGIDTTTSYSDTVAADLIISQSVAAGTSVKVGTMVNINISLGAKPAQKVKVPDIRTLKLDAAKKSLESAGLQYRYSGDENGTVTTVNPAVGTEVNVGSTVTFTLQAARTLVSVPDVTGLTAGAAGATMSQVGLTLVYDADDAERTVASTNPAAGTSVDLGTKVTPTFQAAPSGAWTPITATDSHVSAAARQDFDQAAANSGISGEFNPIACMAVEYTGDRLYLCYEGSTWALVRIGEGDEGDVSDENTMILSSCPIMPPDVGVAGGGCSGWTTTDEAAGSLPADAQAAFSAATSDYQPIALLATQVVSGMNYQVLATDGDAIYVVTIYQDASGTSTVSEASELNVNGLV